VGGEQAAGVLVQPGSAVAAQQHVRAPAGQLQRELEVAGVAGQYRQGLVADLPAVAVGAVEHAASPQLRQAGDRGQLVHDPGGQQQPAGLLGGAVAQGDRELVGVASDRPDLGRTHLHGGVGAELVAAGLAERGGVHAVAGQESVHGVHAGVAWLAAVA